MNDKLLSRREKRKLLIDYYNRILTLNQLNDNETCIYDNYEYYYKDKKLYLYDIVKVSYGTRSLEIDDCFDVWCVNFSKYKFANIEYLDLGGITSISNSSANGGYTGLYSFTANHVKKIPSEMFTGCGRLEKVSINSCVSIGESAFEGTNLKKLYAEKVKFVDKYAFRYTDIHELCLGDTNLSEYSLSDMYTLEKIKCKSCKYIGLGANLYTDMKLKYIDIGTFYENKKYFWVLDKKKRNVYRYTSDIDIKNDTYVYELLFGKIPENKFVIRNKELNWKNFSLDGSIISLELDKYLMDLGLTNYYINLFSSNHYENLKVNMKIGETTIVI